MSDISADFAEKIRKALVEELGSGINSITSAIAQSLEIEPSEHDSSDLRNVLIAISQQVGYMAGIYNQLSILETGIVPDKEPEEIGFKALTSEIKKNQLKDVEQS